MIEFSDQLGQDNLYLTLTTKVLVTYSEGLSHLKP